MLPLWRLTRNRHARRVYDALKPLGVTATKMHEYEVSLTAGAQSGGADASSAAPDGVTVEALPATAVRARGYDLEFSIPVDLQDDDWLAVALADGEPVGRTVVSSREETHVHALERSVSFPGAYVRRVFVGPAWREAGLGSALLDRASESPARNSTRSERARSSRRTTARRSGCSSRGASSESGDIAPSGSGASSELGRGRPPSR